MPCFHKQDSLEGMTLRACDFSRIRDWLYLGSKAGAGKSTLQGLKELRITHLSSVWVPFPALLRRTCRGVIQETLSLAKRLLWMEIPSHLDPRPSF